MTQKNELGHAAVPADINDFYERLKIARGATQDEIKKSYIEIAAKWHPDKYDNNDIDFAKKQFIAITEAYGALSSLEARAQYDSMRLSTTGYVGRKEKDILLVDVSGSMGERDFYPSRLEAAKKACITFADAKYKRGLEDEIALISYSTNARVRSDFMPAHRIASLAKIISDLYTENSTDIESGLECACNLMFSANQHEGRKNHIILLSDGHDSNSDTYGIISAARKIKERNCIISCIGIGGDPSSVDEDLLKKIASVIDNKIQYWFITNADSLNEKYEQLATGLTIYDPQTAIRL